MDVERFRRELPTLWDGEPRSADHPRDRRFRAVIESTRGMATENKLALLNFAASLLDEGEAYVEIGTYRGTSAIGAALGNSHASFFAVDDFSQFDGSEEECRANLAEFGCDHVNLVNGDAWTVLADAALPPVGVYFYDGGHTYREQGKAFTAAARILAPEAVVIIDDASHPPVRAANRVALRSLPGLELLFSFPSPRNTEPRWWNGVDVFVHRQGEPRDGTSRAGAAHRWYSVRYGSAYERVRQGLERAGRRVRPLIGGLRARRG